MALKMGRSNLPNRRPHEVVKYQHWGMSFIAGLGRASPSSPISEVFINSGKSGEQAQTLARDSAVILSLALQYGTPLSALAKAITRDPDGNASGPIGALIDLMEQTE